MISAIIPMLCTSGGLSNDVFSSSWIIAFQDWSGYNSSGVTFGGAILSNAVGGNNLAVTVGGIASGSDHYLDYTPQKAINGSGSFFVSNLQYGEIIWRFDFNTPVALHAIYFGAGTSAWANVKINCYVDGIWTTRIQNAIVSQNEWLTF